MNILVFNANAGQFPIRLRKKYPSANILCCEFFEGYEEWLRKIGFETCRCYKYENGKKVLTFEALEGMKFDLVLGNPPYNAGGVKLGGGFYKEFIELALNKTNHFEMIVPRTFMIRKDCSELRSRLVNEGLTCIRHLSQDTFDANVDTCVISFSKDDKLEPFLQIDAKGNKLSFDKKFYADGIQIPVTTDNDDKEFFERTICFTSTKSIHSGERPSLKHRVVWEYLIGLEPEKYQRPKVLREIRHCLPGTLTKNQRYVEVTSENEALSLVNFLEENAHRWLRLIPRGSSVEGWMLKPLIGLWELATNL